MTSNIGSSHVQKGGKMGFQSHTRAAAYRGRRELVMTEVKRTLSPEFINRIDEIIVFDPLSETELLQVSKLMIEQLNRTLLDKKIQLVPQEEVYSWLVETTCLDRSYGARPLRRAIQRHIEDALSESLIQGKFPDRGEVGIFLEEGKLFFRSAVELTRSE
jgi:ATP-dependent Clp protease ATP-binding subunit ClpC